MVQLKAGLSRDLVAVVYDQLPFDLRDRLTIAIHGDPHMVRIKATFAEKVGGRSWECHLEEGEIHGVPVRYVVPERILALLCTAV